MAENLRHTKSIRKKDNKFMKGKKFLAGILSAVMVFGTMAFPAFANGTTATVSTTDEFTTALADTDVREITVKGTIDVSSVNFEKVNGTKIKGDPSDGEDILKFKGAYTTISIAFTNLTLEWADGNYQGLQHSTKITYDNCKIKGQPFLYAKEEIFHNCIFIQESAEAYNVWTYGGENVEFNNCIFNSAGRSLLIYNEGALTAGSVSVKNCTFNASSPAEGKAAIEIDSRFTDYQVDIDANTTAVGFGTGSTSGSGLYNVKAFKDIVTDTADNSKKLNTEIKVNGEIIMPFCEEKMIEVFGESAARIGSKVYITLKDAVSAAQNGDTVTLVCDSKGDGIKIPSGKDITIDLGGHTYDVNGATVGSPNTETQAFQLLKDSNITIKNGTIKSEVAKMLIQNYSNLTLDGVTLDGSNLSDTVPAYTLSNNNGDVLIKDSEIIAPENGYAFDVCDFSSYDGANVTVENSKINGLVEISNPNGGEMNSRLVSGGNTYAETGEYYQTGNEFKKYEKRSLEILADKTEVNKDETVTVSVKINGNEIAGAAYTIGYETDKFELVGETGNGTLNEKVFKTDREVYADGEILKSYTFKALAQDTDVSADFTISNSAAYTRTESIEAAKPVTADNKKVTVNIKLIEYAVTLKVDGTETTDSEKEISYDGAYHTFEAITDPAAEVSYKINGEAAGNVSIKDIGTYSIEYTVNNEKGYAPFTGTFTLTIGDPEYVVEVNVNTTEGADYVAGKKIVLVYTNVDGLSFAYDNKLMIDVTARGYKYNGTDEYSYVYAFVTDALAEETVENYKTNVTYKVPADTALYKLSEYNLDLNFDSNDDIQDIITVYGIYNAVPEYFADVKYQKNILKADTNGDKVVDGSDTGEVVNAAE